MDNKLSYSIQYHFQKLANIENDTEYDCVKEKLKISDFGNKTLLKEEASILIASAKSKCSVLEFKSLLKTFFESVVEESRKSFYHIMCSKYKLQKSELTTRLANFSNEDIEYILERCENYKSNIRYYSTILYKYEKAVGKINETTCGLLTYEDLNIISYKTFLLDAEEDETVKSSEMEELVSSVIEKLHRLADCILKNVTYERV